MSCAAGGRSARSLAIAGADRPEDVGGSGARSCGAEGRVPRGAQRRVILFFCPIRASSPNQTSIRSAVPIVARDRVQALGERSLQASTAPAAWA